uniref:Putative homing endonuclease n=1 Tax=viral metagenome TaxID=1070528 RepID=A0A6H1Z9I4_9ZZZZ
MKKIQLNQEKFALVDDEDFEYLNRFKWRLHWQGYAIRTTLASETKRNERRDIRMHREIMNCPPGLEIDHIDHDKLNNMRSNMRICTHQQNMCNQKKFGEYKGVSWHKGNKMWQANITMNGKQKNLGYSHDPVILARKYDAAAKGYFGEFAALNFP